MKPPRHGAFTLIELLVAIAIICVLAALLLPALGRSKIRAQRANCVGNLKQWDIAMIMFLHDHGDFFPRENAVDDINSWHLATVATNNDVWYNALPPEMGLKPLSDYAGVSADQGDFYQKRSLFHCPAAGWSPLAAAYPNFSMAMNSKLIVPGVSRVSIAAIQEPVRTPLFLECGTPGEKPITGQKEYNGQPHAYASRFSARHGGFGNLAMADGHVETLAAAKVVDTDPTHTTSYGKSIFPPKDVVWRTDASLNPNR